MNAAVAAELRRAGVAGAPGLTHHTAMARYYIDGEGWPDHGRVRPGPVDGGDVVVIPLPNNEGHERIEYSTALTEFSQRYAAGEWPDLLWPSAEEQEKEREAGRG